MLGEDYDLRSSDISLQGIFIGKVIINADPKALERVKVRIIGVHDMENKDDRNCIWAQHVAPSKGTSGEIPDINDYIYVMFLDPNNPLSAVWIGWCRTLSG
jgi:hypothetical protein